MFAHAKTKPNLKLNLWLSWHNMHTRPLTIHLNYYNNYGYILLTMLVLYLEYMYNNPRLCKWCGYAVRSRVTISWAASESPALFSASKGPCKVCSLSGPLHGTHRNHAYFQQHSKPITSDCFKGLFWPIIYSRLNCTCSQCAAII